jgi:transposase
LIVSDLKQSPKDGVFLFFNRKRDKVKCLSWHKNGFLLLAKQLEVGKFCFDFKKTPGVVEIKPEEFGWILAGLEWEKMRNWKELNYEKFS